MLNIIMVCNLGMSTTMLIGKMEKYANAKGIETKVDAVAYDKLSLHTERIDMILIGPQVRYHLKKYQAEFGDRVPVISVMNMSDYALLKVDNIFDAAYAEYLQKVERE